MGLNCSQRDWLQTINEGSNKTRFEYCKNSKDSVMYVRAIQGHTGRNTKSSCSTEGVLTIRNLSWTKVSLLENERNKVEDSQFSSHRSIFLERILVRKHLTSPSENPEKYIIAAFGSFIKTQHFG